MSQLPRLSSALRVFTGLSVPHSSQTCHDAELLKKRQFVTKKKATAEGSGWQKLVDRVKENSTAAKEELNSWLKELLHSAKQIAGDMADDDVIESAAVYLFTVFKTVEKVSQKQTNTLKSVFGPFPASVATKTCSIVFKITSTLPEDVIVLLGNQEREEADGAATVIEFGKTIKFADRNYISITSNNELSSSDSEDEKLPEIDLNYSKVNHSVSIAPEVKAGTSRNFDAEWLQQEVAKYYGLDSSELGMRLEDLTTTIFDVLSSPKSDSELQNDLFDFLGFERFELIQTLLENRDRLLYAATHEPETSKSNTQRVKMEGGSKPVYGCQVTIQSEQEKAMLKLMRKEDKKFDKRGIRIDEADEFNPVQLRAHREAALLSAASAPIFTASSRQPTKERYPYVFDKMEEARLSSAFIGGIKMHLPDTVSRNNNKLYEEVSIPPSDSAPTHVGDKLVMIDELDEIARVAFKNTKSLNRIQSVVFETAYKTNENLLICAPTGAGKTNIAMLTILHELNQHITQGVIKKDEFKIIYVAPMKALAAEMVRNFGSRLEPLGISVRELTGDMSLTKAEILKTQMMVTTPEKWDVVTRKSTGDVALAQLVKLLIIDEVHLLHDDRGAVIESLVARTLRQVETSQSMIRIVGLSATLPNYLDVARFLHVNPYLGMFFFDGRFRPVPLGMTFIGIKALNRMQQLQDFNTVCYEKVLYQVKRGYQVMVFVHARNETVRTASVLRDHAKNGGDVMLFLPEQSGSYGEALKNMMKSRNKQMKELFADGFSIHHAGMLRQDRNLVEKYFAAGHIKVLVCTATLAWGVNLPAHAVVIKGTQIYDAKKGSFVDLGILDVMQIFGRAGRPQYDTFGHGTIITAHDKLSHYLALMTRQNPIESQFINSLTDNLNAEIALGTVTNVEEAVKWLSYTYLYVRLTCNPLVYGVPYKSVEEDPTLTQYRTELIIEAGRKLDKAREVRFDERTGYFASTDQGRIASHFYIKYDTVEVINEFLRTVMTEADIFALVSKAQEFDQIKVRDEEMEELERLLHETCEMQVPGGVENSYGKVNILLQSYVCRQHLESFSLISDQFYVAQNAARITRSLFEICLKKGWPIMASRLLNLSKTIDKRIWGFETPLRQFSILSPEIICKLEARNLKMDRLREMDAKEIVLHSLADKSHSYSSPIHQNASHMVHHIKMGSVIKKCVHQLPLVDLDATIQPITRTVLRVRLVITPLFKWDDKVHGTSAESFWIWVEDPDNNHIYHSEYFLLHKKQMYNKDPQVLVFTIPIFEPLPTQYYVKAISDRWLGSDTMCAISFQHLILPERHPPHTELLDLQPLPVTALMDPMLETLYKFSHFNPIQTQLFHVLYHSDHNVLLGAPTGSGKTIAAELAIFRVFREKPNHKAVYIAPLKALVRERMEDWKVRIQDKLGKRVVELTGDVTPDMRAIAKADLIVTTPEKWDGVSRSWQTRSYVKAVSLIVIDEIHLLGNDRGPVLEVIVSRTNFISSHTERKVRVIGLSTALANARDLADWLGIEQVGLYNFRPSVRPVPLEVHIHGFPGQHYCPRMATMNKPTFQAIKSHSPFKPVLIFVSSRRQTRLTALDLIAFLAGEDNPKQWLHMPEIEKFLLHLRPFCWFLSASFERFLSLSFYLIDQVLQQYRWNMNQKDELVPYVSWTLMTYVWGERYLCLALTRNQYLARRAAQTKRKEIVGEDCLFNKWYDDTGKMRFRINFRFYLLLLCAVYFTMLYIFHGNLQSEGRKPSVAIQGNVVEYQNGISKLKSPSGDIKRKMLESHHEVTETTANSLFVQHVLTSTSVASKTAVQSSSDSQISKTNDSCFLPAMSPNRTFLALESTVYIYSAYLDQRYGNRMLRLMAVLSGNKKNRHLDVFCLFRDINGSVKSQAASFYELCENHGRLYGGFILSCRVPDTVIDVCHVNVSVQVVPVHSRYKLPDTKHVMIPVARLKPPIALPPSFHEQQSNNHKTRPLFASEQMRYNFTICVPPLFGNVNIARFIEFMELNRLLGFQHFIFYIANVKNAEVIKVLNFYKQIGLVTTVDWLLPSVIQSSHIWYNGQLSAHNDCLYRAMSLTLYLAILDIDEFIIPHTGDKTLTETIPRLFADRVCGLTFDSAFFDPKFSKSQSKSKLWSMHNTGRSAMFSKVRTKVLVKPAKIFEVGIHHVSKPAQEEFVVRKASTSVAYLHHYRDCVPNYGMKCKDYVQDNATLKYSAQLEQNVNHIFKFILGKNI